MGAVTVRWTRVTGTEGAPLQEVEGTYDDPCAALSAIHDRADQFAFKEQLAFEMERLRAECDYWRAKQAPATTSPGSSPAAPEPPPPEPEPQPSEPPPPSSGATPSPADESPDALGAPPSPAAEQMHSSPEPATTSYSALAPAVFAPPPYNVPPEWIPQLLEPPPPEWGTDEDKLRADLLRGHPEPGRRSWSHAGPPAREPVRSADPVDLFSGLFTVSTVDLTVPTPFLPLRLVRCYRSGLPYFGPWGFNWDHNYNSYLRELVDGGLAVWTGRLYETLFRRTEDGWEPEPGLRERVSASQMDGYTVACTGGVTMRYERPAGWLDAQRMPLVEISDRHGNRQRLEYDGQDRLFRVTEHPRGSANGSGRALIFEYGDCGLLEGLRDHAGRRVRYDHHPEIEHLVRVVLPPIAGYPDGVTTEYVYDEEADHPAVRHNIVGVIDADKNLYLENEYSGPDALWAFNRVVRQRAGDDVYEFTYEQLQYVAQRPEHVDIPAVRGTFRPPDGALHVYTFNYRGDLLDHRLRLNRDGSARVVTWGYRYDGQGNVSEVIDPAGQTTALTFDADNPDPCARGNLLQVALLSSLPYLANPRVVLQVQYDQTFQVPTRVTHAAQAQTRLRYDFDDGAVQPTGRLTAVVRPAVVTPDGGAQSGVIAVETNEQGLVTAVVSEAGVRHEVSYWAGASDATDGLIRRVALDVNGAQATTLFEYDNVGFVRRTTDHYGSVTETMANAAGQVEHVVLPAVDGTAAHVRFGYSPEGLPVRVEVPRGDYADGVISGSSLVDEHHLDVLGRVTREVIGANTARPRESHRCHDHAGRPVLIVDPAGSCIRNRYDERGLLLEQSLGDAVGPLLVTHYTYELDGRLRRVQHPDGSTIEVEERDVWRRATRIREANGARLVLAWDDADRLTESTVVGDPGDGTTDRVLAQTRYDYDDRGRLVHEHFAVFGDDPTDAVELTATYHHDADDQLRRRQTATGDLTWEYDGLRRVTRHVDPVGNRVVVLRDPATREVEIRHEELEPGGLRTSSWRVRADERLRPSRMILPDGSRVDLVTDDRDLVVEVREPLGVVRRLRHGLLGELERVTIDPAGLAIETLYEHDAAGRLVRFVDPGGAVTTWYRDGIGRPVRIDAPGGFSWVMTYDATGLRERRLPSGARQLFEYQPGGILGALQGIAGGAVLAVARHDYTFDGLGRLVRATVAGSTVERSYDSLGRLTREHANGREVRVQYDDLNGRIDVVYPDGRWERTELDAAGRPVAVRLHQPGILGGATGSTIVELAYAGPHRLHGIRFPNGVESRYSYDAALRLVGVDVQRNGQLLESCRHSYDARHRRRLTELTGPPPLGRLHTFDAADRLTAVAWGTSLPPPPGLEPGALTQQVHDLRIAAAEASAATAEGVETYGVGPADDRTVRQRSDAAGTTTVAYAHSADHRLTAAGSETITHHPDGIRSADADHLYDVDAFGRIVRVRDAATGVPLADLGYDALLRVAHGTLGGGSFQRWFLGDEWIHQELGASGDPVQRTPHPWVPVPLRHGDASGDLVRLTDGNLSTLAALDGAGNIVERHRFDPFGSPTRLDADGQTPLVSPVEGAAPLFGGMAWTAALELYETPSRLYHPSHGVFLAPDPGGYADSPNPYAYAGHNPVDFADPTGAEKTTEAPGLLVDVLQAVQDVGFGVGEGMLGVNAGLLFEAVTGGYITAWRGATAIGRAIGGSIVEHKGHVTGHAFLAGLGAANEHFNPAYQLLVAGEAAVTEFDEGNLRAGVRTSTVLGAGVLTSVLARRAGGGVPGALRRSGAGAWSSLVEGAQTLARDKRSFLNLGAVFRRGRPSPSTAASLGYSTEVPPADFGRHSGTQLRHATKALYEELTNNPELREAMQPIFDVDRANYRTATGWRMRVKDKFGNWWTWHHAVSEHAEGTIGKLWLIPSSHHRKGTPRFEALHPRRHQGGGHSEMREFNRALKDLGEWLGF